MKVLLIGEDRRVEEMKQKLSNSEGLEIEVSDGDEDENFNEYQLIFDLNFDDLPENLNNYAGLKNTKVFLNAVKLQLAEAVYAADRKIKCSIFGINALPGFVDRDLWEVSVFQNYEREKLEEVMSLTGIEYKIVEDRVGMVTPRILFMIINEACYTVQEGTATMQDIDLAMKLGTNYPMGPFEWCDKIGITDVFETLAAVYEDTKDIRYKICPLLKTYYLRNRKFYRKKELQKS